MLQPCPCFFFLMGLCLLGFASSTSAATCVGCMDGMPMSGCPNPGACGYQALPCSQCQNGTSTSGCPSPSWCALSSCWNCMSGMPMPGCPNPAACGLKPISCRNCTNEKDCSTYAWCASAGCIGCMSGMPMPGCPNPGVCGYTPYGCHNCVWGEKSTSCPNPSWCGLTAPTSPPTVECIDCMEGMSMPHCPDPSLCPPTSTSSSSTGCPMAMVFGTSSNVCILFAAWHVTNAWQYVIAVIGITIVCLFREWMAIYRGVRTRIKRTPQQYSFRSLFLAQVVDSLYYIMSVLLAYILMLIFMTYNVGLCLIVLLGCFVGNVVFSLRYSHARKRLQQQHQQQPDGTSNSVQHLVRLDGGTSATASDTPSNVGQSDLSEHLLVRPVDGDHCCENIDFE